MSSFHLDLPKCQLLTIFLIRASTMASENNWRRQNMETSWNDACGFEFDFAFFCVQSIQGRNSNTVLKNHSRISHLWIVKCIPGVPSSFRQEFSKKIISFGNETILVIFKYVLWINDWSIRFSRPYGPQQKMPFGKILPHV